MKNIEDAQEIAKCCLQDSNRLELRELGFSLVLNILTHNSMLQFPFDIYQAAIDLSHFSVNNSIQLNNRQILGGIKEPQWLITVKEYLHRISPYNYSELNKILSFMNFKNPFCKILINNINAFLAYFKLNTVAILEICF